METRCRRRVCPSARYLFFVFRFCTALFLFVSRGGGAAFAIDETNDELAVQPDPHVLAKFEKLVTAPPPKGQTNEGKCAFYQSRGVANYFHWPVSCRHR